MAMLETADEDVTTTKKVASSNGDPTSVKMFKILLEYNNSRNRQRICLGGFSTTISQQLGVLTETISISQQN